MDLKKRYIERLRLIVPVLSAMASACATDGADSVPCDNPGSAWCDGDRLAACDREDGRVVLLTGVDCTSYGASCHSWKGDVVSDGEGAHTLAACVVPGEECYDVGDTVCVDTNVIGRCEEMGHYVAYGCAQYWCEESSTGGYAACVYEQGQCEAGERKCFDEDGRFLIVCLNGIWSELVECKEGEECVETGEAGALCLPSNDG